MAVKIWISHIKGGWGAKANIWTKIGEETCIIKAFTAGSAKCGIVGHVTRIRASVREPVGNGLLGSSSFRRGDNIRMYLEYSQLSAGVASIDETHARD